MGRIGPELGRHRVQAEASVSVNVARAASRRPPEPFPEQHDSPNFHLRQVGLDGAEAGSSGAGRGPAWARMRRHLPGVLI